jgi:hypothetical protein
MRRVNNNYTISQFANDLHEDTPTRLGVCGRAYIRVVARIGDPVEVTTISLAKLWRVNEAVTTETLHS